MSWFNKNPNNKGGENAKESDQLATQITALEAQLSVIPDVYTDDKGQEKRNKLQAEIDTLELKRAEAIRKEVGT
jgi:hypothetical protein